MGAWRTAFHCPMRSACFLAFTVLALSVSACGQDPGESTFTRALDAMGYPREGLSPEVVVAGASGARGLQLEPVAPGRYRGRAAWDGPLLVTASAPPDPGLPALETRAQAAPPPAQSIGFSASR